MRYVQFLAGPVTVTARAEAQDVLYLVPGERTQRDRCEHTRQSLNCLRLK